MQAISAGKSLLGDIKRIDRRIDAYNSHWLNRKHTMTVFAVIIMALIFTSMLAPSLEFVLWGICGVIIAFLVVMMMLHRRKADKLNTAMEAARKAFMEYERGRRKR